MLPASPLAAPAAVAAPAAAAIAAGGQKAAEIVAARHKVGQQSKRAAAHGDTKAWRQTVAAAAVQRGPLVVRQAKLVSLHSSEVSVHLYSSCWPSVLRGCCLPHCCSMWSGKASHSGNALPPKLCQWLEQYPLCRRDLRRSEGAIFPSYTARQMAPGLVILSAAEQNNRGAPN